MDGARASDLYRPSRQSSLEDRLRRVGGPLGVSVEAWKRFWVEPPRVQILVVVANIQTRTLKTEVEKGSM
ncbi:hypothetical protein BgiBS90_038149 [Biomphalaria glabrata]|nr:hypothetical protein BgiBS90_038149 [Biomphalaria glabrata]